MTRATKNGVKGKWGYSRLFSRIIFSNITRFLQKSQIRHNRLRKHQASVSSSLGLARWQSMQNMQTSEFPHLLGHFSSKFYHQLLDVTGLIENYQWENVGNLAVLAQIRTSLGSSADKERTFSKLNKMLVKDYNLMLQISRITFAFIVTFHFNKRI